MYSLIPIIKFQRNDKNKLEPLLSKVSKLARVPLSCRPSEGHWERSQPGYQHAHSRHHMQRTGGLQLRATIPWGQTSDPWAIWKSCLIFLNLSLIHLPFCIATIDLANTTKCFLCVATALSTFQILFTPPASLLTSEPLWPSLYRWDTGQRSCCDLPGMATIWAQVVWLHVLLVTTAA